jgi:hypothetical protein
MELFFIIIISVLLLYIGYQEYKLTKFDKELKSFVERTMVKFMSRDLKEYQDTTQPIPPSMEVEENPYKEITDMGNDEVEKVLRDGKGL